MMASSDGIQTSHRGHCPRCRRGGAALATSCAKGNSSTSPSTQTVTTFATAVTAADGSIGLQRSGAPPAPTGGPVVTADSSGSVSSGGADLVRLRSASPFQTVYVAINNVDGFFEVPLTTAVTDLNVTVALSPSLPSGSYQANYRVASAAGSVGSPTTVTNTVQPAGPTVNALFLTVTAFGPFSFTFRGQTFTGPGQGASSATGQLFQFDAVPPGTYTIAGTFTSTISFDQGAPNGSSPAGLGILSGSFAAVSGPHASFSACHAGFGAQAGETPFRRSASHSRS